MKSDFRNLTFQLDQFQSGPWGASWPRNRSWSLLHPRTLLPAFFMQALLTVGKVNSCCSWQVWMDLRTTQCNEEEKGPERARRWRNFELSSFSRWHCMYSLNLVPSWLKLCWTGSSAFYLPRNALSGERAISLLLTKDVKSEEKKIHSFAREVNAHCTRDSKLVIHIYIHKILKNSYSVNATILDLAKYS